MNELAKRLVACKHFWWMPGMKTSKGEIVLRVFPSRSEDLPVSHLCQLETSDGYILGCIYPSLTDPGTLGCLLALVREAWGCDWLTCQPLITEGGVHRWRVVGTSAQSGVTEAEALVAALEAAE